MASEQLQNDLLLKACRREKVERTPVWIMRQAGRYLPSYRRVREKTDFLTMCRTPELAAQVTLQPVDLIGVDAAIIFSDILVIPEAMGMKLRFHEGQGPVFEQPLRHERDFAELQSPDVADRLSYVLEAIKLVKRELAGRVPVIGFAGAPWTLAAYMVEGRGSRNFINIKKLMYTQPHLLKELLEKLSSAVADFLLAQMQAGANVVQVFDSWAGILPQAYFHEFSLPYLRQVVERVKSAGKPVIVFAREAGHSLEALAEIGADALSISWTEDLAEAKERVQGKAALQGNLDPCVLFAPEEKICSEVVTILQKAQGAAHIFNLGHGILKETPPENARAMVQFVKEESPKFLT